MTDPLPLGSADRVRTPRVFIASATQTLGTANALSLALRKVGLVPLVWNDAFELSRTNIENLEKIASSASAAIFVMGVEDKHHVDGRLIPATRDNVLFEFGLFLGKLGRSRCAVVRPDVEDWRWPSDLQGLTTIRLPAEAFGVMKTPAELLLADPRFDSRIEEAAAVLVAHILSADRVRWGSMRTTMGYFLRAIRDTYTERVRLLSTVPTHFRLNLMTPASDSSICIACVDYESLFHEDEFDIEWNEDNGGKCGHAWKHCVQTLYGGPELMVADSALEPMPDWPSRVPDPQSVLSTPVLWREQRVGVLNFDSLLPAGKTFVHHDAIRECFLMAAARVGDLLHGSR
jgi:hypothetical protein